MSTFDASLSVATGKITYYPNFTVASSSVDDACGSLMTGEGTRATFHRSTPRNNCKMPPGKPLLLLSSARFPPSPQRILALTEICLSHSCQESKHQKKKKLGRLNCGETKFHHHTMFFQIQLLKQALTSQPLGKRFTNCLSRTSIFWIDVSPSLPGATTRFSDRVSSFQSCRVAAAASVLQISRPYKSAS